MKAAVLAVVFALCAVAFAEEAPEVLFPCSFRFTFNAEVRNKDGEVLATTRDEIARDNGDYWFWKSTLEATDPFLSSVVPDHQWSIIWRPDAGDKGMSYRHDFMTQKCYAATFEKQPTPYNWIQSKTYGLMWFDERVMYNDMDCTLYTAVGIGNYGGFDYESEVNFYVNNKDATVVHFNGTVMAAKKQIDVVLVATDLEFVHNEPIPVKDFAVQPPCPIVNPPSAADKDFQAKCYENGSTSMQTMSWLVLLVAILVYLMDF